MNITMENSLKEQETDNHNDIEPIIISDEYWFESGGHIIYANGDIGDYNHESIVIERCAGELLGDFNVYSDNPTQDVEDSESNAMLKIRSVIYNYYANKHNLKYSPKTGFVTREGDEVDNIELDILNIPDFENDPAEAIIIYLKETTKNKEEDINDFVLTAFGSTKDARDYAINKWNWARVHGNNIEVKKLDYQTLKNVSSGIWNALEQEGLLYNDDSNFAAEEGVYYISTYTGKRFSIKLKDMESPENVSGLEEVPQDISSAKNAVKKMDDELTSPYYRNKGVIGDSFNVRTWLYSNIDNSKFDTFVESFLQEAWVSRENLYSWLSPSGQFYPLINRNHGAKAQELINTKYKNYPVIINMQKSGKYNYYDMMYAIDFHAIRFVNSSIYTEHPSKRPTQQQMRSLIQTALENDFKRIIWDNWEETTVIWTPNDL